MTAFCNSFEELNAVSQRIFGLRYFEAFDKLQHILEPLEGYKKRRIIPHVEYLEISFIKKSE